MLDGQSALKWTIEKFLLNINYEIKSVNEIVQSASAVLSGLILNNNLTTQVADQIVDDIKALLCAANEEYTRTLCSAKIPNARLKASLKFCDQVTILTRIPVLLRETATQVLYSFL